MTVCRCVCRNVHFATLAKIAQANQIATLAGLQEKVCFGDKCRRCHPYVRGLLKDGRVNRAVTEPEAQ